METNQSSQSLDEILKKNKNFLTILLILGVGIFYWTQLRPENIKKGCAVSAGNSAVSMCQEEQAANPGFCPPTYGTSTTYRTDDYDKQYANCLAENGLN